MGSGIFVFMLGFIFCLYLAAAGSSMIRLDVERLHNDQTWILAKPQQILHRSLLFVEDA
ncbi:hypothetical protein [Paenibacillus shenyangensis]|uniref:hypothetical protein n=1 Tax=Paenibacillus sp. A9 TaxID=1284352 RepID=UPI001EE6CFFC|nr:hypothetical protein [Paenibacillus sp. A9]